MWVWAKSTSLRLISEPSLIYSVIRFWYNHSHILFGYYFKERNSSRTQKVTYTRSVMVSTMKQTWCVTTDATYWQTHGVLLLSVQSCFIWPSSRAFTSSVCSTEVYKRWCRPNVVKPFEKEKKWEQTSLASPSDDLVWKTEMVKTIKNSEQYTMYLTSTFSCVTCFSLWF